MSTLWLAMGAEAGDAPSARLAAFCSKDAAEVFESIIYQPQIWSPDPFDVETIHLEARDTFDHLLRRAGTTPPPKSGRVLLLHGEAGSGKTHLLRAFRHVAHEAGGGYFGYLQMTTEAGNYGRYLLSNLIASLDQPYFPPKFETSGLMRLSTGLFEAIPRLTPAQREEFRAAPAGDVPDRVHAMADLALTDPRFAPCDLDLMRALLYLQRDDPQLKSKILKWLRCEDLSTYDRRALGELVPRTQEEHPLDMVSQLGRLMYAVHEAALVVCVDQLEDVFHLEMGRERFRKIVDSLVALIDAVPTAVVVIACLEDYFAANREQLTRSKLDRLQHDPEPIRLHSQRSLEEIEALVGRRLEYLYESAGLVGRGESSIYPFRTEHLQPLANFSARKVLDYCRDHHNRCIEAGTWVEPLVSGPGVAPKAVDLPATAPAAPPPLSMEQAWNDFRALQKPSIPEAEAALAELLAWGIDRCNAELPAGYRFEPRPDGRLVSTDSIGNGNGASKFLIAVCQKPAVGGGLQKQIGEVEKRAGGVPVVLVRSTSYPGNNTKVGRLIGSLIGSSGRMVQVEDSDWRTLLAFRAFHLHHGEKAEFHDWQRHGRPISQLPAIRKVLALDKLTSSRAVVEKTVEKAVATPPAPAPTPTPAPAPIAAPKQAAVKPVARPPVAPDPLLGVSLTLGVTRGLHPNPVQITVAEMKQHTAFLGGSGSGKTTLALSIIEQLLVRGIPAILLDRKGDLSRYADPEAWTTPDDPETASRLHRLRDRVDVALFTPGASSGRPLAIPVVPEGIEDLPTAEREQLAEFSASAIVGMMAHNGKRTGTIMQVIVKKAIEVLVEASNLPITLESIRELVQNQDEALLSALGGGYDPKDYRRIADDLLTLRHTHSRLLATTAPVLDIDMLLGRDLTAIPGKTRLSIINTQSLRSTVATDFWVSQFLVALGRWGAKSPSDTLQAVVMLDEADQYLPAVRQPSTKAPLESLLRRARSAGLGLMLATQSPGDFDYKCRDNIRAWFVGRVKEPVALNKLKPMFSESRVDIAGKVPGQQTGEFYLLREGEVTAFKAARSLIETRQLSEQRVLELAPRR